VEGASRNVQFAIPEVRAPIEVPVAKSLGLYRQCSGRVGSEWMWRRVGAGALPIR